MPITLLDIPILSNFFCAVYNTTGMPPQPLDATPAEARAAQKQDGAIGTTEAQQQLPKGVVLGPDGKPCVVTRSVNGGGSMC